MSPLESQRELQRKIRHTSQYDDTLSDTAIAKRFRCSVAFVKKTLAGEAVYPGKYQGQARRYGVPVKEYVRQLEAGNRYCSRCKQYSPKEEYFNSSHNSLRHRTERCKERQCRS